MMNILWYYPVIPLLPIKMADAGSSKNIGKVLQRKVFRTREKVEYIILLYQLFLAVYFSPRLYSAVIIISAFG